METGKQYSEEYKKEAVKLAKEIGNKAAAEDLGIPDRKSTRLNSSHTDISRMPSSA